MNRLLPILVIFIFSHSTKAQNLVPNPSFESYSSCPTAVAQIANVTSWFDPPDHSGSADYFHTCATNTSISVPNNAWGNEQPATGDAYVGLNLFYYNIPDFREYIEVQLTAPLVAGSSYNVSFNYSLADKSSYSTDAFGIYFSPNIIAGANSNGPINVSPQLAMPVTIANKIGWSSITISYTAVGGEEYMLLGNFLDDAATPANPIGNSGHPGAYLYLDDISVSPADPCQISFGNDTTLCQGETLILDATTTDATYLWQDNSADPTFTVTGPGTYWAIVTSSCGVSSDTIHVSYNPLPSVHLGNDTTLCQSEVLILDATTPNATYLWQNNTTAPVLNVSQPGTYWAEVTVNNCSASDTIQVAYTPSPVIDLGNDTTLCEGEILALDATTPNATYLWQDNSTSPVLNVAVAGTYWAVVTVSNCSAADTIQVDFIPAPAIHLGNDRTLCEGDTLVLDATTPDATYLWQDNSVGPTFTVIQPGNYWVEVTKDGCSSVHAIAIEFGDCDVELTLPNVISPNGDGVNDSFTPVISKGITTMHTVIYNRWGNVVFETNAPHIGWNASSVPDGTYFWIVSYTDINGKSNSVTGHLTVLR